MIRVRNGTTLGMVQHKITQHKTRQGGSNRDTDTDTDIDSDSDSDSDSDRDNRDNRDRTETKVFE
jgi:hypothetical protein